MRAVDLAAFYAAIANEGLHSAPHMFESIEINCSVIYRHDTKSSATILRAAARLPSDVVSRPDEAREV
jgi:membrane peptidoglycan carboxypeptidase